MSIQALGGSPYNVPVPSAPRQGEPSASNRELTTVTTHCDKKHWHDSSCPHSVSTRPAPKQGEPGYLLDVRA